MPLANQSNSTKPRRRRRSDVDRTPERRPQNRKTANHTRVTVLCDKNPPVTPKAIRCRGVIIDCNYRTSLTFSRERRMNGMVWTYIMDPRMMCSIWLSIAQSFSVSSPRKVIVSCKWGRGPAGLVMCTQVAWTVIKESADSQEYSFPWRCMIIVISSHLSLSPSSSSSLSFSLSLSLSLLR